MALSHSPKIVTDGLVFAYDMFNNQKSWRGAPTINNYSGNPSFANWNSQDVVVASIAPNIQRIHSASGVNITAIKGLPIANADTTKLMSYSMQLRGVGNAYLQVHQANTVPNGGHAAVSSTTVSLTPYWQTVSFQYYLAAGVSSQNVLVALLAGASNYVEVRQPQVEQNAFATPYINGTRSNTQAILDLMNSSTITANSLTYASDGEFGFNGSTNNLAFTNPISSNLPYTILQWVKPAVPLTDTIVTNGTGRKTPLVCPGPQWNPGYWMTARTFRVHSHTEYRDHTIDWVGSTDWHMIGQVFDGTNCYGIIDGVILSGGVRTAYSPALQSSVLIGAETTTGNAYNWNGKLDSIQIYNRALSTQEVQQNFNALKGRYGL